MLAAVSVAPTFELERGSWRFFPPPERGALGALDLLELVNLRPLAVPLPADAFGEQILNVRIVHGLLVSREKREVNSNKAADCKAAE